MRFQIGTKVAVVDDVLEGQIISINNDFIEIKDAEGMIYQFKEHELIPLNKDQFHLSKFLDINNKLLKDKVKDEGSKKTAFTKEKNEVVFEVDLHIHQLVESTRKMDNYDMLNLQLETAKRKIEFAISKRFSKVVFIHGVGEGVLRTELHSLLKRYPVDFYDASYKKYGLGATEVYIYQNHKS